ncbi:MAG: YdiU family protein [Leptothrix sp. (in: Bacteria)]|nr:YdiU family protein [Leptothrix sp. (in: b-proteobacteria)]
MNARDIAAPLADTPVDGPAWRPHGLLRRLGAPFAVAQPPQALPGVHWIARNHGLAAELGLGAWLAGEDALPLLAGNAQPPHGTLASAYSGHQFGVWAGQLGDGRALLLGEVDTPQGPMELQLKGSGLTPYSRMGDGRAVLRSSIREYLCSEAMHGLGLPTTRALALVGSPQAVRRETVETAAVVTRVAPSFLRFGHFEHFTHTAQDTAALRTLADATIAAFYPEARDAAEPYAALLEAVTRRTAALLAQWQAVGFCHGVMNTDNMSILGLTIDYGPFGFLDAFDPGHVCNHSDHQGRYAWARQPNVALWNLHALAQALLPLMGDDTETALAALQAYHTAYPEAMLAAWRAKLGLAATREGDRELADDLLKLMAQDRADFSITLRRLAGFSTAPRADNAPVRDLFIDRPAFDAWAARYAERLAAEHSVDAERAARMNAVNPKYVLRNHLAEGAIARAREGDFSEVQRLHALLQRPYDEQPANEADAGFPPDWAAQLEISCSS